MDKEIIDKINLNFKPEEVALVTNEISSITLNHVMAASEYNLRNTRFAILKLAKGNVNDVVELTKCAKIDFRDVIMWAMEEK